MKKLGLLLISATGAMLLAGCAGAANKEELPVRDKRIIVEVGYDINSLTDDGVKQSQKYVYNNIKEYATKNIKKTHSYDTLVNAFVLEVNENDIDKIKEVPGVKSVTIDKIHAEQVYSNDGAAPLYISKDPTPEENISATTMNKPNSTNDGEGTIIAILDNEFHFRGKTSTDAEWHHEVYEPLANSVKKRYTFDTMKAVSGLNAKRNSTAAAGEEGSLYFNSKVPFYYDYGGTSKAYGKEGDPKHDVHSDMAYHGSHVSSIAAANAPLYKGIAPKAQLACMKVFTEYKSKGIGDAIGLSDSSGAYDTVILKALEDCVKLKVDGINMSLGSDLDDFDADSITLKTLTKLANEGILSAISAGNNGKSSFSFAGAYGNWGTEVVETGVLGSYANNPESTIIASGQPTKIFYENAFLVNGSNVAYEDQIVNREGSDDDYTTEHRMSELGSMDWVYVPGFGTDADYSGLDVQNKVAVVNRGSTAFSDKYSVAKSHRAKGLIIINNDPTAGDFNFRCSFGDVEPTMPIALVLYKDKQVFQSAGSGSYTLITEQTNVNPDAYTMSSFSTDGARFDLDIKPDVTAPGESIKGAVPEFALTNKTQEERELLKNKAYAYLSGTSMSAPNYAGAQSVVLSKATASSMTDAQVNAYRKTVDLRIMSTANQMHDAMANPETDVISTTSPRMQGAGMVDLAGALNTDVYLEGVKADGTGTGKAKIVLKNNEDIAKGDVKLSFLAHNESEETRNYNVTVSVMRPAIAHPNDLVTKDYNYKGEIDSIESLPGSEFYDTSLNRMAVASGSHEYKDAVKVSKDVEYFASQRDYNYFNYYNNPESAEYDPVKAKEYYTVLEKGFYYNASQDASSVDWKVLPSYTAQSVKDVEIASFTQTLAIPAGDSVVNLNSYSLSKEDKDKILETFEYGCMIEGFVTLESTDSHEDLSLPYLGFYSGTDRDANASYASAPVFEPFNFEKDITKVYPSDYINDVTKSLVGKDKVNFESMMVAGYAESPDSIDIDKVLTNDLSFDALTGFYKLGTDPATNEYVENPKDNLYVGSDAMNTLIIQQFILRSVADNYFSITNKETGELVYQSAVEDMLFGDTGGKYTLYKSHVDAGYLSAGYVAHRGYAIVPLYDEVSGKAFPSGEYELKFNYLLSGTGTWVSNAYTLHIDSDAPEVMSAREYKQDGVDRVRFEVKDQRVAYGVIGLNRVEAQFDSEKGVYFFDEEKSFVMDCVNEVSATGGRRLFVRAVDFARGSIGCIIHFKDYNNFNKGMTTVQGKNLTVAHDFTYEKGVLTIIDNNGNPVEIAGDLFINNEKYNPLNPKKAKNYTWAIVLASVGGGLLLIGGGVFLFFFFRKKKLEKGGKE